MTEPTVKRKLDKATVLVVIRGTLADLQGHFLHDIDALAGKALRNEDEKLAGRMTERGRGYSQALADAEVNLRRAIEEVGE